SRRRHTRWPRDWSSDVCSSDLEPDDGPIRRDAHRGPRATSGSSPMKRHASPIASRLFSERVRLVRDFVLGSLALIGFVMFFLWRSEERRVGKGCRLGWWVWLCK